MFFIHHRGIQRADLRHIFQTWGQPLDFFHYSLPAKITFNRNLFWDCGSCKSLAVCISLFQCWCASEWKQTDQAWLLPKSVPSQTNSRTATFQSENHSEWLEQSTVTELQETKSLGKFSQPCWANLRLGSSEVCGCTILEVKRSEISCFFSPGPFWSSSV